MHLQLIFGLNAISGSQLYILRCIMLTVSCNINCRFGIKKVYKSFSFAFCIL